MLVIVGTTLSGLDRKHRDNRFNHVNLLPAHSQLSVLTGKGIDGSAARPYTVAEDLSSDRAITRRVRTKQAPILQGLWTAVAIALAIYMCLVRKQRSAEALKS
jgi:hypothetical protein